VLLACCWWPRYTMSASAVFRTDHRNGAAMGLALNAFLSARLARVFAAGVWFSLRGLGLGFALYFLLYVIRAMAPGT